MRCRSLFTSLLFLLSLVTIPNFVGLAGAVDELALKQQQYNQKLDQINQTNTKLNTVQEDYQTALEQYEKANNIAQAKQNNYDQAKADYDRATKNGDLVNPDKQAELARTYQAADRELKAAQEDQKKAENERDYREKILTNLKTQKNQQDRELLSLKADIFDLDLRQPVWVEGSGESILDENKTIKECEKLALDAAYSDALEKGGKAVIESVTRVEMFKVTKDEIKLTAKVQKLEEDTSGDYGRAKQVIAKVDNEHAVIKYQAKVRVKVQSVDTYNPYREQLKEMGEKELITGQPLTLPTENKTAATNIQNMPTATDDHNDNATSPDRQQVPGINRKLKVAVLNFDDGAIRDRWWGRSWKVGEGVSDQLVTALLATNKFRLIEREQIDNVLKEQNFGGSGRVDARTAAEIGKILGVQLLVIGRVTEFSLDSQNVALGLNSKGLGLGVKTTTARVAIDARVVDAASAEIKAAVPGKGEKKNTNLGLVVNWNAIAFGSSDFQKTNLGIALREAVNQVATGLANQAYDDVGVTSLTGTVYYVRDNQVIINIGADEGVQAGMIFTVEHIIDVVKDPDTGQVVDEVTEPIAQILVTEVRKNTSTCKVTSKFNNKYQISVKDKVKQK